MTPVHPQILAAIDRLQVSARHRPLAVWLASPEDAEGIAKQLGVGLDQLDAEMGALFAALGVQDRSELLSRLLQQVAEHASGPV